jgi:hypothetical protein
MAKRLDDEFLGYVTEQPVKDEREAERTLRIGLLADLMTRAGSETGINLEKMVARLEAHCIRLALQRFSGDVGKASIWLGYRTPDALNYVLRRHPSIKPGKVVKP